MTAQTRQEENNGSLHAQRTKESVPLNKTSVESWGVEMKTEARKVEERSRDVARVHARPNLRHIELSTRNAADPV